MDGRQLLSEFIKNGPRQAQIARDAGCSQSHLSLYLRGKSELSAGLARRISAATGGKVPVSALVPEKVAEAVELLGAAE